MFFIPINAKVCALFHNDNLPVGARKKIGYHINFSHVVYSVLKNAYGLPIIGKRKRGGGRKKNCNTLQERDNDGKSNSEKILFYDTSGKKKIPFAITLPCIQYISHQIRKQSPDETYYVFRDFSMVIFPKNTKNIFCAHMIKMFASQAWWDIIGEKQCLFKRIPRLHYLTRIRLEIRKGGNICWGNAIM